MIYVSDFAKVELRWKAVNRRNLGVIRVAMDKQYLPLFDTKLDDTQV